MKRTEQALILRYVMERRIQQKYVVVADESRPVLWPLLFK